MAAVSDQGVDAIRTYPEQNRLFEAAAFGDTKTIKSLVKKGIDVNTPDEITGTTPLLWSIINSKFQVAKLLIGMGADLQASSFNEKTAYDWARDSYDTKIFKLLMKKQSKTQAGGEPVKGILPQGFISSLLSKIGIGTSRKAIKDSSEALHDAARQRTNQTLKSLAKNREVEINALNKNGETPLHTAIKWRRVSNAKLLLTCGSDMNIADNKGCTPLHLAITENSNQKLDDLVKDMVMRGVDLNAENSEGHVALKQAFQMNDIRTAKLICKSLPTDSSYALDAFKMAIDYDSMDVLRILLRKWSSGFRDQENNTLLHIAIIRKGKTEMIKELLEQVDVNVMNDDGDTPLHIAVEMKSNETVCLLLHHNADVSISNKYGDTVLHTAVQSNLLIFILLVEKCDMSVQNIDGESAFHLAAKYEKTEFIDLMIKENKPVADPYSSNYDLDKISQFRDLVNNLNCTALHYACAGNNYKLVEKLLEIDSNTTIKNNDGLTALDIAIDMNHLSLVSLFKGPKLCGESLAAYICTVCIEIPTSPNFVYKCKNEHIYCSSCDNNMQVWQCPQCGIPIKRKQRWREMEEKLAIMFPNVAMEGRTNSFECLFQCTN